MSRIDKYTKVLQTFEQPVTIMEWTKRIVENYPAVLIQTNKKITVSELATAIRSKISVGEFSNVEVINSEYLSKVRYVSDVTKSQKSNQSTKKPDRNQVAELNTIVKELALLVDKLKKAY